MSNVKTTKITELYYRSHPGRQRLRRSRAGVQSPRQGASRSKRVANGRRTPGRDSLLWRDGLPFVASLRPSLVVSPALLATLAKMEKVRLSERTKAGLTRARANGRRLGRPPRDYGALTAAHVAGMRAAGLSWSKMEASTGIPAGSLRRLAKKASSESG